MKRHIIWKRLLILVGAGLGLGILVAIGLFTNGQALLSAIRASLWTADAAGSQAMARAMLEYRLPPGYRETKLLNVGGGRSAVIITDSQHPGNVILVHAVPNGVRTQESWRQRYEERWSNDLDGHRYSVQTVQIRQMQIGGSSTPVRFLEGIDENGMSVKQVVCIVPGKAGDVLVGMTIGSDTWDLAEVEAFYRSIQ